MTREKKIAGWIGALLGVLCALLISTQGHASDHSGQLSEEFHQTYTLSPNGSVDLENINGGVHISAWERNEVKVDAVKYAHTQQQLDEAKIEVNASGDHVSIRTEYPGHDHTFNHDGNDPASVEYTVTVPRGARLDEIKLVNGGLEIQGVEGKVRASCVNGRLSARGLSGSTRLSTVNGRLQADFLLLGSSSVELSSVNGELELTLPSDSRANVEASTVSGGIENDFGLAVSKHQWVGHELRGELGGGGTEIKLSNVNGRIEIRHAGDNKALSPAKDMRGGDDKDSGDEI